MLSSLLICGSVPPSNPHHHEMMEDDPAEKLVSSSEKDAEKISFPAKRSTFSDDTVPEAVNHAVESVDGTEMSSRIRENCHGEDVQREVEVIDKGKSLSKNKELVLDPALIAGLRFDEASTSYDDQHSPESECVNITGNADALDRGIHVIDSDAQNHVCSVESSFQPHNRLLESLSDEVSVGKMMGDKHVVVLKGSVYIAGYFSNTLERSSVWGVMFRCKFCSAISRVQPECVVCLMSGISPYRVKTI